MSMNKTNKKRPLFTNQHTNRAKHVGMEPANLLHLNENFSIEKRLFIIVFNKSNRRFCSVSITTLL